MKKTILLIILLLPLNALAIEPFTLKKDQIKYAYDGDTFFIKCRIGLRCEKNKLGIRAMGLDTPEIRGKCPYEKSLAKKAKYLLVDLLEKSKVIIVTPQKKRPYGRYGRLIASVTFDGIEWADAMIKNGVGRPWKGRRENWCR